AERALRAALDSNERRRSCGRRDVVRPDFPSGGGSTRGRAGRPSRRPRVRERSGESRRGVAFAASPVGCAWLGPRTCLAYEALVTLSFLWVAGAPTPAPGNLIRFVEDFHSVG